MQLSYSGGVSNDWMFHWCCNQLSLQSGLSYYLLRCLDTSKTLTNILMQYWQNHFVKFICLMSQGSVEIMTNSDIRIMSPWVHLSSKNILVLYHICSNRHNHTCIMQLELKWTQRSTLQQYLWHWLICPDSKEVKVLREL